MALSSAVQAKPSALELDQLWRKTTSDDLGLASSTYPWASCFNEAASSIGVPAAILLAVARGESDFNPRAVSKANAIGVMQIQWPGTAKDLGILNKDDLFKPCISIDAGARYLKKLHKRYGNWHSTLAAYNYGPGRIKPAMGPAQMPDGANWYSAYIYDHLSYIRSAQGDYGETRRVEIITFNEPFRARAFVAYLQGKVSGGQFDWFRLPRHRFQVTVQFSGQKERLRVSAELAKYGFSI